MRERYRDTPPIGLEERADAALASGAFADAEEHLKKLLEENPRPDKAHHALLKLKALPLYEMAYGADRPEMYEAIHEDANEVYGFVGELLRYELSTFSPRYYREIGRISELTFYALHLRQLFAGETDAVMLPAPATDDRKGVDFYESPVGTKKITDGRAYQIKTQATDGARERYKSSRTVLVSMDDLDKYATDPDHPESLPRTILRELGIPLLGENEVDPDGLSSEGADQNRLDRALKQVEDIAKGISGATERALTRTTLRALKLRIDAA